MAASRLMRPLAALAGALAVAGAGEPDTCAAGQACGGAGGVGPKYHWPGPHGRVESYGNSPHTGPFNLTASLKWTWHHPKAAWADMPLAAAIDDKNNVYISADQGVYKLSPEGQLIWQWHPVQLHPNTIPDGPALEDGRLFINDIHGTFWALDMETGQQLWETRVSKNGCTDTGVISAHKGLVICDAEGSEGNDKCSAVVALNASTGALVWKFAPDSPVWDFMAQYDDEDTLFFQDITGKAYRNFLYNGSNIWKSGGFPGSWTDGTQMLAPNGIVYTTNTNGCGGPDCHGQLNAYRASTGEWLWRQETPRPPNSSPVVGKIGKSDKLSVVIPIGQQPHCETVATQAWHHFPILHSMPYFIQVVLYFGLHRLSYYLGDYQAKLWGLEALPTGIMAFDAETGQLQWYWEGPTFRRYQCPGDEKWFEVRSKNGVRGASCPTPWSAPRIGADGTIYVGNQNGHFFAIRDTNGDGQIDPKREVSDFDCGAEFSSAGSAHAPGLVVIASGDVVYAFGS